MPLDRANHTVPLYIIDNVYSIEYRRPIYIIEPDPVITLWIQLLAST